MLVTPVLYYERTASRMASERAGLVAEAVNDHLRVLTSQHPLDIESGDVHQVKPWFEGRLDFAPVVAVRGRRRVSAQGRRRRLLPGPEGGGVRLRAPPAPDHAARLPRRRTAVADSARRPLPAPAEVYRTVDQGLQRDHVADRRARLRARIRRGRA